MKTLILNGSPRAAQGNTEVFIRQFMRGAGQSCPVRYVAKEPASEIAQAVRGCGVLLVFLPLYVHAMPGIVLKVFEQMKPAAPGQKLVLWCSRALQRPRSLNFWCAI